jgi:hypothetical protein
MLGDHLSTRDNNILGWRTAVMTASRPRLIERRGP